MTERRYVSGKLIVLAGIATILLVACDQPKSPPKGGPPAQTSGAHKVFIQFEGPWAFAADPQDPNNVIAIAPKAVGHHDLYVKASNDMTLMPGIYNMTLPTQTSTTGPTDPAFVHTNIPTANLQQALAATGLRYAVRIPKPEAYLVASRAQSRVGTTFPPPASGEGDHATATALRYSVSSLSGISVGGITDTGAFNPLLLQVDTPFIRFVIEPAQMDDPADKCETHSRESFRDLVKLLGLTLYVDFPDYTPECENIDVQRARKVGSLRRPLLDRMVAVLTADVDMNRRTPALAHAGMDGAFIDLAERVLSSERLHSLAAFFFAHGTADCKGPNLYNP